MSRGRATRRPSTTRRISCRASPAPGALPPLDAGVPAARRRGDRPSGGGVPAHRPGRLQAPDRRADPRRHRHADGLRPRPPPLRAGGRTRGDRRDHASGCGGRAPACCWRRTTTSASPTTSPQRQMEYEHHGDRLGAPPATLRPVHPFADEGARRARAQHVGTAARRRRGHQGDRAADRDPRSRHRRDCSTTSPRSTSTRTCRTTN